MSTPEFEETSKLGLDESRSFQIDKLGVATESVTARRPSSPSDDFEKATLEMLVSK